MNNGSLHNLVQSNEIIELLKSPVANNFLTKHWDEKPDQLALKYQNKVPFNLIKLTQLLQLYQKAQYKIPLWVTSRCAMHSKSYEQCSHYKVASYKSTLFKGDRLLDLTAGLGVDSYYFSKSFKQVVSLERDPETCAFNQYNVTQLGATNILVYLMDLERFDFEEYYDVIYLDPDRRLSGSQQLRSIESFSPDIFEWYPTLLEHTNTIVIKLSPMVDISYLEDRIPNLALTYVISFKNEVKEVLIVVTKHRADKINRRVAIDIGQNDVHQFSGTKEFTVGNQISNPKYLLEPSKSIIKAELAHSYATSLGLDYIHPKSLYFFSHQYVHDFIGRQFEILQEFPVQWAPLKKQLRKLKESSINIAQRNFFIDVQQIRKKLGISEGGNNFLFFTIDHQERARCFYCKPTTP